MSTELRVKRAMVILQELMDSSSDDEDEHDNARSAPRSRRNEAGHYLRRGSFAPQPRQNLDLAGKAKWNHDWSLGFIARLLSKVEHESAGDDGYWARVLRARIGVPPSILDDLVQEARSYPEIKEKSVGDGGQKGPCTVPLPIKISTVLSWMRTGGTMQGAADRGELDVGTLRRFRATWARAVVMHEYKKWVKVLGGAERDRVLELHAKLGFPGCIAFADGVERFVDLVPYSQTNMHLGKEKSPTRGHMVFSDARGVVHSSSPSHDGNHNDKTKCQFDRFSQGLKDGSLCGDDGERYGDVTYPLMVSDNGDVEINRGLYSFTDNGMHPWRCFQYPSKEASSVDDAHWSVRGESVRKPGSECVFGRVKKRFPCFKNFWTFSGNANFDNAVQTFDDVWYLGLMLHNRLMHYDGLDTIGLQDSDFVSCNMAVDRERVLNKPVKPHQLPVRRAAFMGGVDDDDGSTYEPDHFELHGKLVAHFSHAWERREIRWCKTAKVCRGLRRDDRPFLPGKLLRRGGDGLEDDEGEFGGLASDLSDDDEW